MPSNELNNRWVPKNRLTEARDRHRNRAALLLGDANIVDAGPISPPISPLVRGMSRPMITPMIRQMGETTIQTRRRGNRSLWENTPLMSNIGRKAVADIDLTNEFSEFDSVGWEWDRRRNVLRAYLSTGGKTYTVTIPASKIKQIFNACLVRQGCEPNYIRETTIDGIFKKIGKSIKKATRGAKKAIKNPREFVKASGKTIKFLVKKVGKTAINVASSPIFGGIMAGMAVIPPLTAVGGAGLAAFAAANAAKPYLRAAESAIDTVDAISQKKKASEVVGTMTRNVNSLPAPARKLMTGALKSVSDKKLSSAERAIRKGRAKFRLRQNKLMPFSFGR